MILQSAAKRIQDAYDEYGHIFDVSQFYEKQAIHRPVWVEHYDKEKNYRIPFGARIVGIGKIIKRGFKRTNPYQHI